MSITLEVDEEILRKAEAASNIHDPSELIRRLLEREIARKALARPRTKEECEELARYFASLGGTMPDLEIPRRRRVEDYEE